MTTRPSASGLEFQEGGVEGLVLFDLKGSASALSPLQIDELRTWATRVLPTSTTEVGRFIMERFGVDYGRSGLIKLMNRIGFDWRKPESAPDLDAETQQKFIDRGIAQLARSGRGCRLRRRRPSDPRQSRPDAGCRADSAARFPRRRDATG